MSIVCLSHVMRHSEAQLGARLVLFVLAEHAHDDGANAFPTVPTIMERTRMSRRSVQGALRRLEADEMISAQGVGPNGQTNYRVAMASPGGGADSAPAHDLQGADDDAQGRSSRHEGGAGSAPNPSFNPSDPNSPPPTEQGVWAGVPDTMRTDGQTFLRQKRKVAGRLVTEAEMAIAAAALAEFNRQLESRFELGPHLAEIVGRVRDHPSWDTAAHVRLVQSAFRVRWWERRGDRRRPKPGVVWGPRAFTNVVDDATREAEVRREMENDHRLRDKIFSDGRSWDELTSAEQANHKEQSSWGNQPWLPKAEPEPAHANGNGNGNGHAPGLTWENFGDVD